MAFDSDLWIQRKIIFVVGKGGVGKSVFSEGTARALTTQGKSVLLCRVAQVFESAQRKTCIDPKLPDLEELRLNSWDCFAEYVTLKLRLPGIAKVFLKNPVVRYLQRAAPGVREMVLLGKIWHERENFDHVVVDMPSTGYALAMFKTPVNFSEIFPGGPVYADALAMLQSFRDPGQTSIITTCLPEEMPIQESLELTSNLANILPGNPPLLVVNKVIEAHPDLEKRVSKAEATRTEAPHPMVLAARIRLHHAATHREKTDEILRSKETLSLPYVIPQFPDPSPLAVSEAIAKILCQNHF